MSKNHRLIRSLFITETGEGIGTLSYLIVASLAGLILWLNFELTKAIGFLAWFILIGLALAAAITRLIFLVKQILEEKRERKGPYAQANDGHVS